MSMHVPRQDNVRLTNGRTTFPLLTHRMSQGIEWPVVSSTNITTQFQKDSEQVVGWLVHR